jgi:hypothetical protein
VTCSPLSSIVARRVMPWTASPLDQRHASRTLPANDVTSISPVNPMSFTAVKSIPGAHFTTMSRPR